MTSLSSHFSDRFFLDETPPGDNTNPIKDILIDADALVALTKEKT